MPVTINPNALTNDAGDWFYPDGPEDAEWFAREHGARPVQAGRCPGWCPNCGVETGGGFCPTHLEADELAADLEYQRRQDR